MYGTWTGSIAESLKGATKVVATCLGLRESAELLIFVDETTWEVGEILGKAAETKGVHPTMVYVPARFQAGYVPGSELSLPIKKAIEACSAIANCFNVLPECMGFRIAVIKTCLAFRKKVGHMPGITEEILAKAVNIDYDFTTLQCHKLAMALAKGREAELISTDEQGVCYSLKMDIGGWSRAPVKSNGIIPDGVWGNIPGGEVYIAPVEGSAEGEIVVDGSLPGFVIPEGKQIKVSFENGRLASVFPKNYKAARLIFATKDLAEARGDPNWNNLGELGIGVNQNVKRLCGNPVLDEKKYGTAHIGLGNNDGYGGRVQSTVHLDIIVTSPEIRVDGKTILKGGHVTIDEGAWKEDFETIVLDKGWVERFSGVSRTGAPTVKRGGLLHREWCPVKGRVNHMTVGNEKTAHLALLLYEKIPMDKALRRDELSRTLKMPEEMILRLVKVLDNYGLVRLH